MTDHTTVVALVAGVIAIGLLAGGSGVVALGSGPGDQEGTPTDTPTPEPMTPTETPTAETPTPTEEPPAKANETPTPTPTPIGTPIGNVTVDETDVRIGNQTTNGTALVVNTTSLEQPGFLVVFNLTLAGPLGHSSYLEAGAHEDVTVTLEEPLTENETVLVLVFEDTNDNQAFDLGTDEVVTEALGQPIGDTAHLAVTADAEEPAATPTPTTTPDGTPTEDEET